MLSTEMVLHRVLTAIQQANDGSQTSAVVEGSAETSAPLHFTLKYSVRRKIILESGETVCSLLQELTGSES